LATRQRQRPLPPSPSSHTSIHEPRMEPAGLRGRTGASAAVQAVASCRLRTPNRRIRSESKGECAWFKFHRRSSSRWHGGRCVAPGRPCTAGTAAYPPVHRHGGILRGLGWQRATAAHRPQLTQTATASSDPGRDFESESLARSGRETLRLPEPTHLLVAVTACYGKVQLLTEIRV
jgi:hypothetical protein